MSHAYILIIHSKNETNNLSENNFDNYMPPPLPFPSLFPFHTNATLNVLTETRCYETTQTPTLPWPFFFFFFFPWAEVIIKSNRITQHHCPIYALQRLCWWACLIMSGRVWTEVNCMQLAFIPWYGPNKTSCCNCISIQCSDSRRMYFLSH